MFSKNKTKKNKEAQEVIDPTFLITQKFEKNDKNKPDKERRIKYNKMTNKFEK